MDTAAVPAFKNKAILELIRGQFNDPKTKLSSEANELVPKLIELFVKEAIHRSLKEAKSEQLEVVQLHHLEKILPTLLLDF